MAFVTTTSPDLYATTSNLEEIPAGADPLQYADDEKMNQILVGLTALHGWASGVPVSETANGHFMALAAGSSAAVSITGGVRIRQSSGAIDYSYNTGAYARLLSKLTLASQATGDIMYASAADTWSRLAAGTNGYVLTMSGGVPVWAAGGGGGLSSPVGAADGGTGITSYAVGDIIYASGATTLSKLADVATGNALISGGVTTAPAWGKIGLTTHVSGTLPAANGGTGQGGGYAVGDMLYASGASALSKLAAVATGQVLASAGVTTAPAYTANPTLTTLGLAAGSTAACSLYATGDPNTGVYFPAADQIALVSGGTARVVIDGSTELHNLIQTGPAGSASLPTYGFTGDPNTGAYGVGADQYGITAGGTLRASFNATQQTLYTDALIQETNAATTGIVDVLTVRLRSTGTAAANLGVRALFQIHDAAGTDRDAGSISWIWDDAGAATPDSSGYLHAMVAGTLTSVVGFNNNGIVTNAGSAATPAHRYNGDDNSGWYSSGSDELSASLGGTSRHKVGTAYARYALNGGVYKDSSAFEVITGGVGADGRARFENNISSTGVSGVISTNDNNWSGTMLLDGGGTTRTGVAGNTYFVGLTSQAHFGALTNTDSHWITGTADSTADRVASAVYNAGNRYLRIGYFTEYSEMSAPAAGAANTARVYAVDNGSGKTSLRVIFNTGAAQTLATEP